jgi:hypothetical protein
MPAIKPNQASASQPTLPNPAKPAAQPAICEHWVPAVDQSDPVRDWTMVTRGSDGGGGGVDPKIQGQ